MVEKAGHSCHLHDCADVHNAPDPGDFQAVIVAGSVHQRRHQEKVADFVKSHLRTLKALPGAFVSVSLSIIMDDGRDEAESYVTDFTAETGWYPQHVHMAAGAIRYLEYDFFKEFTLQHIVFKGKKALPPKEHGNPVLTDWDALAAFVDGFLEQAT